MVCRIAAKLTLTGTPVRARAQEGGDCIQQCLQQALPSEETDIVWVGLEQGTQLMEEHLHTLLTAQPSGKDQSSSTNMV